MDDAFHHIQARTHLACEQLADPEATFFQVDLAGRALADLARQVAAITWDHSGWADLYEEIAQLRVAALQRMAEIA